MTSIALVLGIALVAACLAVLYKLESVNAVGDRQEGVVIVPGIATDLTAFKRAFAAAAGQQPLEGNHVILYQNGGEIFPPMLKAIDESTDTVHFATFVFEDGALPNRFGDAFVRAAERGVEVRMLLDSDGARNMPDSLITRLRSSGCDLRWFRRAEWFDWTKYNGRMHAKLLIVDGCIGFTGGAGIGDEWSGAGESSHHWRDTHARLEGPAVSALQAAFVADWNETTSELPLRGNYFPRIESAGDVAVCIVQSNPSNGSSAAQRAMAAIIGGATRSLWITNPYFVPSQPFISALGAARERGVDVKILLPGRYHNKPAVRRASRRTWMRLLTAGVELYEHQLTMVHGKVVIADGCLTMVGSINFDPRSFTLNAECAATCFSEAIAADAADAFKNDLTFTRRVTIDDLNSASVLSDILDRMCYWARAEL